MLLVRGDDRVAAAEPGHHRCDPLGRARRERDLARARSRAAPAYAAAGGRAASCAAREVRRVAALDGLPLDLVAQRPPPARRGTGPLLPVLRNAARSQTGNSARRLRRRPPRARRRPRRARAAPRRACAPRRRRRSGSARPGTAAPSRGGYSADEARRSRSSSASDRRRDRRLRRVVADVAGEPREAEVFLAELAREHPRRGRVEVRVDALEQQVAAPATGGPGRRPGVDQVVARHHAARSAAPRRSRAARGRARPGARSASRRGSRRRGCRTARRSRSGSGRAARARTAP